MGKCVSKCLQISLGDRKSLLNKRKKSQYIESNNMENQMNNSVNKDTKYDCLDSDRNGQKKMDDIKNYNFDQNGNKNSNGKRRSSRSQKQLGQEEYIIPIGNLDLGNQNSNNQQNNNHHQKQEKKNSLKNLQQSNNNTIQSSQFQFTDNQQNLDDIYLSKNSGSNLGFQSIKSREFGNKNEENKSNLLTINIDNNDNSQCNTLNPILSAKQRKCVKPLQRENSFSKLQMTKKSSKYDAFTNHFSPVKKRNNGSKRGSISQLSPEFECTQGDMQSQYIDLNSNMQKEGGQFFAQGEGGEVEQDGIEGQQNKMLQCHYIEEEDYDTSYSITYEQGMREHVFS